MKFCVISPFLSEKKSTKKTDILIFIQKVCQCYDFVVLPGYQSNHPSYSEIQKILNDEKSNAIVFIEEGSFKGKNLDDGKNRNSYLVSANEKTMMPKQEFAIIKKVDDIDRLQKIWSQRNHQITDKNFSFIMCGEIHAFNMDGVVKYQSARRKRALPIGDILINPTHTLMNSRRWIIDSKLSALSLGKKVVIHVANNNSKNFNRKNEINIQVYSDGKQIQINRNNDAAHNLTWAAFEIRENQDLFEINNEHKCTNNRLLAI